MNNDFSSFQEENIFRYFLEISKIPRGSGNMEQISNYVADCGRNMGYEVRQDELHNVVIFAPASTGYETCPTVMLQGHMDMVAEKTSTSNHDFETEGLDLFIEGDLLGAKDTTLGGDDGIAVAYMLAILSEKDLPHPALECVFTVDEEVGLLGAAGMDFSFSHAKYLINLDSELEGTFLVSCAGGVRWNGLFPIKHEMIAGTRYKLMIQSSIGGHSGTDIIKERPNTDMIAGQLLYDLQKAEIPFSLVSINGGTMDNAIPCHTEIEFISDKSINKKQLYPFFESFRKEYETIDAVLSFEFSCIEENIEEQVYAKDSLENILFFLQQTPNGIQTMNHAVPGLVETSLNLGIMKNVANRLEISFSIRSSMESKKNRLVDRLTDLCLKSGGSSSTHGDYPGWAYKKDSKLRDLMVNTWNDGYGTAKVEAIHAGLETGLILGQCPELDIVSMGPNMYNIHTTMERLSISSTEKCYQYLCDVLKRMK